MSSFWSRSHPAVNSVQPTGYFPLSNLPSSTNRHDEFTTEALIEASRQLPARLEKLQQDNERLKQQVDSLQKSLENRESISQKNRELSMQMDNLRKRHAAMAERRVNMNQGRTENTLSANRQSDIEREYREEFRDGQRLDAVDKIDASLKKGQKTKTRELSTDEQLKAYRLACVIFEISYECASNAKESFLSFYSSLVATLVTDAPSIGLSDDKYRKLSEPKFPKQSRATKDSLSEIMVLVKEEAGKHNLEKLIKEVKKELKKRWKETTKTAQALPTFEKNLKRDLKDYIEYCTRFSWRIVTQVPPLKIDYKSSTFNPFYHNESQAFAVPQRSRPWVNSGEREEIKCYVWPTLYDFDNRVIQKGDVVLKEQRFHEHTSSV